MKNHRDLRIAAPAILFASVFIFLTSCAGRPSSLRSWRGEAPDEGGSWVLTVFEDDTALFAWDRLPQAEIAGEAYPDGEGAWIFHIDEVRWFEKWVRGWTEATFSAWGSLRLVSHSGKWSIAVIESPELESVREARMRYWDDGYYGDRARDLVQRRWIRSRSVAEYMTDRRDGDPLPTFKAFHETHRTTLFPEVYDRKSPRLTGTEEDWIWAEGVVWDTRYTRENLPEELHAVRDSGTLYRDEREGPALVYLAWIWPKAWENIIPGSTIEERSGK